MPGRSRPVAAILVMGAIVGTLFVLCTPRSTSRSSALAPPDSPEDPAWLASGTPGNVRVLVLEFDPVISDSSGRSAHRAFGWSDPRTLAAGYVRDVADASSGRLRYQVVEWRTIREFPPKLDGFRYTAATYAACLTDKARCHDPDGLDYVATLERHGVPSLIDAGRIDEVWLFGGPYFGYFEAAMAGPGAFDINGGPFPDVKTRRAFAIMGFNSERGVAEMLHDLCHRIEATMARVYGGWRAESLTSAWARFAANARQSGGRAGVGSCHYPPNATGEYDYGNERAVESDADDWLRYPALTGARRRVDRRAWGGPDYHREYMRWWLRHLPRGQGVAPDGKLANWWSYVVGFDSLVIVRDPR